VTPYTAAHDWSERQGRGYITVKFVRWEIGAIGSGLWLNVPPGFSFDVSVPRALRWLFSPHNPQYLKAAALHDYALSLGWDRVSAAAAFSEALRASGVPRLERLVMVLGVVVFKFK